MHYGYKHSHLNFEKSGCNIFQRLCFTETKRSNRGHFPLSSKHTNQVCFKKHLERTVIASDAKNVWQCLLYLKHGF